MKAFPTMLLAILVIMALTSAGWSYSALEDYKTIQEFRRSQLPPIPPHNHARVARTLVHKSDWASIGTISTDSRLAGFPMVNIISIADSARGAKSTGDIYFLMTDLDFTGKDWRKHNNVTLSLTSDEDASCKKQNIDTMEPTCPRAIISGSIIEMPKDEHEEDYDFGWKSFISRHPAAKSWIKQHNFYLCKLNIYNIFLLDYYGGAKHISVEDYYKNPPKEVANFEISDEQMDNGIYSSSPQDIHIRVKKNKYRSIHIEI